MGFHSQRYKQCLGCGPDSAKILFLGDRPGKEEMYYGHPFAGRTGDELERKLWDIRLNRDEVFLANLLLQPPAGKEVTPEEIKRDEAALWEILDTHRFDLVVTLGATTTRYFLGPDATMERNHALAHELKFHYRFGTSHLWTTVFPQFHLAAGFHSSDLQPYIEYDWAILGAYLKGQYQPPAEDRFIGRETYSLIRGKDVETLLGLYRGVSSPLKIAIDTEGIPGAPWGLSFSLAPGSAFIIKADDLIGLAAFNAWLHDEQPFIILHNSLYDIGMLREMGVNLDGLNFRDTMIMAFLLQIEPQGLKPLSFRHSGMLMKDFHEVAGPYQKAAAIAYLEKALELDFIAEGLKVPEKKPKPRKKKKSESDGEKNPIQETPDDPAGCPF